jgi:hypothetical protein
MLEVSNDELTDRERECVKHLRAGPRARDEFRRVLPFGWPEGK